MTISEWVTWLLGLLKDSHHFRHKPDLEAIFTLLRHNRDACEWLDSILSSH